MMLSDEKITHTSHILLKALKERNLIEVLEDEGRIRRQIKNSLEAELKLGEEIENAARKKVDSYSRKVFEGSPEWEVLYKRFLSEEGVKRGRETG